MRPRPVIGARETLSPVEGSAGPDVDLQTRGDGREQPTASFLKPALSSFTEATRGSSTTPSTPEALEARVQEALACPCVADLRDGPCGPSFVAAFSCFLRAQAGPPDPAGVAAPACLPAFKGLQACMVRHPEAFTDFVSQGNKEARQVGDALFDAGENGETAADKGA